MKLELRNVACGYDSKKIITEHVNLVMDSGEICCILGPNGVGKTTLFKTILNLIPPLSGTVYVDGEDVGKWNAKQLARVFAYVAQVNTPTYPYLVREMAMMGRMGQIGLSGTPSRKDYEIVEKALDDVGIRHLRDKRYTEISGGERQLLMIARALAQEPKFLVIDEPTATLDNAHMVPVMKFITELAENDLGVIFTSHMPDQAFMCDSKVALMFRNAPMIYGDAADVITEKNLYEAYHTEIQVLEIIGSSGKPVRVVAPKFRS